MVGQVSFEAMENRILMSGGTTSGVAAAHIAAPPAVESAILVPQDDPITTAHKAGSSDPYAGYNFHHKQKPW